MNITSDKPIKSLRANIMESKAGSSRHIRRIADHVSTIVVTADGLTVITAIIGLLTLLSG